MGHDAFRYDFTGKELFYYLFKKKVCPECGSEMTKFKGYETVDGAVFNNRTSDFFVQNAKVKHYLYFFHCPTCKNDYRLSELAK